MTRGFQYCVIMGKFVTVTMIPSDNWDFTGDFTVDIAYSGFNFNGMFMEYVHGNIVGKWLVYYGIRTLIHVSYIYMYHNVCSQQ